MKAFAGQSATFGYTVTLTKDETSGLNVVQGLITVANPAESLASMALSVVDQVQPANLPPVTAAVDCDANTAGNQPTLTLAAGASASCTYYAELPSATNGVNTATVTLNGLDFSATVPYAFGEQVEGITEPGTVTVTDSLGRTGPYPDPLWPIASGANVPLTAGENTAFWFSVSVPTAAPAGDFTAQVNIGGVAIPVRLHVFNFAISDQLHVASQMNFSYQTILSKYEVPGTGDEYWTYVDKIKQFFIDHRLTPR